MGDLAQARQTLLAAETLAPDDARTYYAIGLVEEALGNTDEALARYQDAPEGIAASDPYGGRIEQRRAWLALQTAQADAAAMREGVVSTSTQDIVAVVPFETRGDDDAAPIGRALSEVFAADLSAIGDVRTVERVRVAAALDELGLGRMGPDDARARRVGGLLRSLYVVTGRIEIEGDGVRVDLSVWDGDEEPSSVVRAGRLGEIAQIELDLVLETLTRLGADPTDGTFDRALSTDARALASFGRGLAAEDAGRYAEAAAPYAEAVDADRGFAFAAQRASEAARLQSPLEAPSVALAALAPAAPGPDLLGRRLTALGQSLGAHVVPSGDGRQPSTESSPVVPPVQPLPSPPDPPAGGRN